MFHNTFDGIQILVSAVYRCSLASESFSFEEEISPTRNKKL